MILKNNLLFYFFCIMVIALELYYLVSYFPTHWSEVQVLRAKNTQIAKEITSLDRALKVLQDVDKSKLLQQLSGVNAAIPSQKKTSGLVNGVISTASNSGVVLKQLDFSPGKISTDSSQLAEQLIGNSKARSVAASLVVLTDIDKLINFLQAIQKASQLLGVENVQFTNTSRGSPQAAVSLKVYFEPLSDEAINWDKVRLVNGEEQKVLDSLSSQDSFILPEEKH